MALDRSAQDLGTVLPNTDCNLANNIIILFCILIFFFEMVQQDDPRLGLNQFNIPLGLNTFFQLR